MYHKPEVYTTIRRPFNLAYLNFERNTNKDLLSADALFARYKVEIADEVAKHAHIPSMSSPRAIRQIAIKPWQKPNLTKDDGILEMSVQHIMQICFDWLNNNVQKITRPNDL